MAEYPVSQVIPTELRKEYPAVDYSLKIIHECQVSGDYIILLLDMPHLVKCIVTSLELRLRKSSTQDLKYGKCHLNIYMIEIVWCALGGDMSQLQELKVTTSYFDKNVFPRMNVALAM